ncbi:unnamed protein product [Lathyrus oleraceus]
MMKNKSFIFVLFSWALVNIFVMTIESSKDEKQFGATHEFQNKIGVDYKKPWLTWNNYKRSGMGEKGGKKVELGSGETGSVGNGGEGGAQGEDEQNGGEIKK